MKISKNKTIHMIGIGGTGMCPIAQILLCNGHKVTGSDLKESINTISLKDYGAKIFIGQKASNLREADIVVYSSAITENNPEYAYAKQEKLPLLKRSQMLEFTMREYEKRVACAGTHGKTTTTAMITNILDVAKKKPTFAVGSRMHNLGKSAEKGNNTFFIAEADESDGSFLDLKPNVAVLTNVETEHMDYYKEFDNLIDHFTKFMNNTLSENGYIISNLDDKNLNQILSNLPSKDIQYYSVTEPSKIMAKNIKYTPTGTHYDLYIDQIKQTEIHLQVFGLHNVYNSLAAICFCICEEIALEKITKGLFQFTGVKRRFDLINKFDSICIYDDYAHHPTEIKSTLEGIKNSLSNRIICIFQPHRYSRTQDLLETFPDAFNAADIVIITEIYPAYEEKIEGISGKLIVDKMQENKKQNTFFIGPKSEVANKVLTMLEENDLIITMGAGDITSVAKEISARIKNKKDKLQ
jgi:UDP-N-acetylmuramate--alanine ligase